MLRRLLAKANATPCAMRVGRSPRPLVRVTFLAQRFVLAVVVGDALMVESLCARDAFGSAPPVVRRSGPAKGPVGLGYCFAECSDC